jgi:cytidine deaminase
VRKPDPAALLKAAAAAARKAYAPYSKYRVGAALLCADGAIFTGCNVENASYGLTNCAERTAAFSAVVSGRKRFLAIAIVADGRRPPYPCGACRQVLAEFCPPSMPVYVAPIARLARFKRTTLGQLLPRSFRF